jgi:hypothetical protein
MSAPKTAPAVPDPVPDRAAINRQNASHSTGPKTTEGKERVRLNALKHGIYSKDPVLESEDHAAYNQLGLHLAAQYRPATPEAVILVRRIQEAQWRLDRVFGQENALLQVVADQHHEQIEARFDAEPAIIDALAQAAGMQANARLFGQCYRNENRLQRIIDASARRLAEITTSRPHTDQPPPPANKTAPEPAKSQPGFVPSNPPNPDFPQQLPAFTGPLAREKRRQWLRKNGFAHLAKAA